jgi:hypothetical protein
VVEVTPASKQRANEPAEAESTPRRGQRVVWNELAASPAFLPPPGAPRVTTEEVLEMLKDFP